MIDAPATTAEERYWAAAAHGSALLLAFLTSWFVGFAGMLAAGVFYLVKRGDSPFVAEHAGEAFNFNLSMFLYTCLLVLAGVLLIGTTVLSLGAGVIVTLPLGLLLLVALAVLASMWLACSIVATVKAWSGERYRYPLTLRLI